MNPLQAIILGIVQGLSEFLPISSSGHLKIVQTLMGLDGTAVNLNFFNVLLHFGTLAAVVAAFWKDLARLGREGLYLLRIKPLPAGKRPDRGARRLFLLLPLSLLPLFLVLPFKSSLEAVENGSYGLILVGAAMIVTGFLLFFSDRFSQGKKTERSMKLTDALLVGIGQALAVIPGLSRSGTTISAATALGCKRTFAVKFSFLMSIPTILAAFILSVVDVVKDGMGDVGVLSCLLGMLAAAASGYLAIRLLRMLAERSRFGVFSYYCWGAGLFALILSLINV